jgi:hypothetical protein
MKTRISLLSMLGVVSFAYCATLFASEQEARPVEGSERARAAQLRLGEELSRPRPDEDAATATLLGATVGPLKEMKTAGVKVIPRDQHPHHQGCVRATFTVAEGLPEHLKVGIFRRPRAYHALIRYSNGSAQEDNVPNVHGMAIKLLGVEARSLIDGAADAGTQDFILINHPVFFAADPKDLVEFVGRSKVLAEAKKAGDDAKAKAAIKGFEKQFSIADAANKERFGTPSPLEMTFFSMTPYRLGQYAVKYVATPDDANKSGLPRITERSDPNALREAMISHLTVGKKEAKFTFGVQLQSDPVKMPVEDATVPWDSKPIVLATIVIPSQTFASEDQLKFCEALSYTPWHASEEHRPLGGINRARKPVYQETSKFRHEANGAARGEPTLADLDRLFKLGAGGK